MNSGQTPGTLVSLATGGIFNACSPKCGIFMYFQGFDSIQPHMHPLEIMVYTDFGHRKGGVEYFSATPGSTSIASSEAVWIRERDCSQCLTSWGEAWPEYLWTIWGDSMNILGGLDGTC